MPQGPSEGDRRYTSGEACTFFVRDRTISNDEKNGLPAAREARGGAERHRGIVGMGSLRPARGTAAFKPVGIYEHICMYAIAGPACRSGIETIGTAAIGLRLEVRVCRETRTHRERAPQAPELEVTKRHPRMVYHSAGAEHRTNFHR